MAAKKASETTKDASAPAKAESKKTPPKKAEAPKVEAKKAEPKKAEAKTAAPTKKAAVAKTEVPKPAGKAKAETAAKSGTPKAAPKKAEPAAAKTKAPAAPKKAAIKLNPKQLEFLKKVHEAGETGYAIGQKVEQKTIEALKTRKLLKSGAKNKETGKQHYMLTKAGEKHLSTSASAGETASATA